VLTLLLFAVTSSTEIGVSEDFEESLRANIDTGSALAGAWWGFCFLF
jgi:hypothetical protein